MRHDIVLVETGIPVASNMIKTDLDIENEKYLDHVISLNFFVVITQAY